MNLYRKGIGLLGLVLLLLAVSAGGCEGAIEQAPRIIKAAKAATEFIGHEKIPLPVLQKIAADTHGSSDNLPGLAKQISESVPESTVEHEVEMKTNGMDPETANKDIADACKLAERLSGEPSGDSSQAKVASIEKTLKDTNDDLAVSTICHVADFLES